MPGAMPMTSTLALTNATITYALALAGKGYARAIREHPGIAAGANIVQGTITHEEVAQAFGLSHVPVLELLGT